MAGLPLRLRVFLFFCLLALGGTAIAWAGLWVGARQADGAAGSAFATAGLIAAFGLVGLTAGIWLLFDEHVAKPIESLAAALRLGARAKGTEARYLGDLAPAAAAVHETLRRLNDGADAPAAERLARLERDRRQLLQVLSDIPLAILILSRDHQIALYDGQAAELLAREAPARLGGSLFDYLAEAPVRDALAAIAAEGPGRGALAVTGRSGQVYTGHLRLFPEGDCYALMLEPLSAEASRPPILDLDLIDRAPCAAEDAARLRDLTFVVFDSETTGLDPRSDEVVQIGAVRVVGGRRVEGETFETLVDPGRPIPPGSTAVHGVGDADVMGAPRFETVARDFRTFCEGAVIVAHNAPFDMAFLHRALPGAFTHPVLDTVHMSAIVFGGSAEHTLDALCDRLDIVIPPSLRHTAMGDAVATADVLVALLPVLDARGLETLADLRAEARKHRRLLREA
jgi:DNA polymerase-3 subunit epsilon